MSLSIDWTRLTAAHAKGAQDFINARLAEVERPDFIGDIVLTDLDFGNEPPSIEIVDITDPFEELFRDAQSDFGHLDADDSDTASVFSIGGSYANGSGMNTPRETPPFASTSLGHAHSPIGLRPADPFRPRTSSQMSDTHASFGPDGASFGGVSASLSGAANGAPGAGPLSQRETPDAPADERYTTAPEPGAAQVVVRLQYKGDARFNVQTSLVVNIPTPQFMSLPISLGLRRLQFEGQAIIVYRPDKSVCFSLLPRPDNTSSLREMRLESKIGDANREVLQNVDRIEKFIVDTLRKLMRDHIVFPNKHTVDLAEKRPVDSDEFDGDYDGAVR